MDLKTTLTSLTYDLLGLTVRLRLPRLARQEEAGAEYQLKIEPSQEERQEEKVSYLQWRYGERLEEILTASPQLPSHLPSQTRKTENKQQHDKTDKLAAAKLKKLRKDFRVINNYMSIEQISYIENWLEDQPEHFQTEDLNTGEVEEERTVFTDAVDRNTRNIFYRKVSIV